MGRAKLAMEFISKEKKRNTAFIKRKKGLFKKGREFSILCNVPVCIIIYPYNDAKQPLEAEVYAFKGDTATTSDHKIIAMEIIERYLRVPKEERNKRALNLYDMFDEWTRKADQELCKLRQKNALANKYPSSDSNNIIDGFDVDQLMELVVHLDQKIECVKQRISVIKGENNHHNQAAVASLVPYIEPTPITPFENNDAHYHNHQMGYPELFEGGFANQIPLFNYPAMINNNYYNHYQEYYCNQVMPYSNHQQIAYPNEVGAIRMDDHDNDNDNGRNNNNLVMYNMNDIMGGVGPMYYDQRSVIAENADATSSYGGGLPMSMPLQLPMVRPNVPLLPRQRQYQMFY